MDVLENAERAVADKHWKALKDLKDPFNDAVNYKSRLQKDFFNQLFLRTEELYKCLEPSVYYLLGEKGSGKTAYATYLENNLVQDTLCKLTTMTESQYNRFIAMKRQGKLEYSDYANIWRPILLNMASQFLIQKCKGFLDGFTGRFDAIEAEITRFNRDALNPEVEVAFRVVSENRDGIKIGIKDVGSVSSQQSVQESDELEHIRHHLLEKETSFKDAIGDLKLKRNVVLFMDGIDYRPEAVPYNDYLACIKGLGEAAWHLNTEFFGSIRDTPGRIKFVLLLRPDVFHALNIYNSNSRLRDNSVLLDWTTTESDMRDSELYAATGRYFASQQTEVVDSRAAADHYLSAEHDDQIFRRFLRSSFQKPRDILTFIQVAKSVAAKRLGHGASSQLPPEVIHNPYFTKDYSVYLLGEVKNYAAFYMEQSDFSTYLKFFQYLDGQGEFTYEGFSKAFERFKKWVRGEPLMATTYLRDAEALLQFFYDVNVVGYSEEVGNGKSFYHFAFRERTLTDIAPKVKMSGKLRINPGITKALDIGLQKLHGNQAQESRRKAQYARPARNKRPAKANANPREGTPIRAEASQQSILNQSTPPASKPKRRRPRHFKSNIKSA
ncbi:P-loop ATPase, Sll1717 family [Achromobacter mucicolens]|uniref:P-loop ATPase, Sll1717 family n=1 Tax=Achromobacter mucicolens TaxID=1389922 RepID=UPI002449AA66|nr:hypothetical protein [Achromobacter mucicolens]MDH1522180.1 hypothetical protein [Achromobacter mucicolens]